MGSRVDWSKAEGGKEMAVEPEQSDPRSRETMGGRVLSVGTKPNTQPEAAGSWMCEC